MKTKVKFASKVEWYLWAETVRRHYMSLEGAGEGAEEEAGFFLNWHWDMSGACK